MIAENLIEQTSDDQHDFWTNDQRVHVRYYEFEDTRGGDVKAQCEVRWNEEPAIGLVKHGWMALGGTATTWARDLSKARIELTETDWHQLIQRTSFLAKRRYQEGEPFDYLGDEPKPEKYLIYPLVVASGPTVISAEGGSGKSFLGLAMALTVATGRAGFLGVKPRVTGPVLYLDWEDAINTHNERAWALCRALDVPVPKDQLIYSRQRGPLRSTVKSILKKISNLPVPPVMVIIDSVGKARGGDVNSAEDTNKLFAALDQLALPAICIDHKSKEAINRKLKGPIGSVYSWNSARIAWDIEKAQAIGHDQMRIVARNVKSNSTRLHHSQAWEVDFDNVGKGEGERLQSVSYRPIDANRVVAVDFSDLTIIEGIEQALSQAEEPLSAAELAEILDAKEDSVRRKIRAFEGKFVEVGTSPIKYQLVERDNRQALPDPM